MDNIQRQNTYHAKCIMDLNVNPDYELEEKYSKLTFRDLVKFLSALPDKFLDLTMEDVELMAINEKDRDFVEETLKSLTEEQSNALGEVMKILF